MKEEIKNFLFSQGAFAVGIADVRAFNLSYERAVSFCLRLDDSIIDSIGSTPTPEYADHYREINKKIDEISERLVNFLEEFGYQAKLIPASKILDDKELLGELSHKAVARIAGIGWQGKSLLIINPNIGPRFRLGTVLTNAKIEPDSPIKNRCGRCTECTKACPSGAIKNVSTKDYYKDREEAIDLKKCYEKTLYFKSLDGIGATICGVCVKVCPWGRKKT